MKQLGNYSELLNSEKQ